MRKEIYIIAVLLGHFTCFSQTRIAEFDLESKYSTLQGASLFGDSICLFVQKNSATKFGEIEAKWMQPAGEQRSFATDSVDYKSVIAVTAFEDKEWYYYLNRKQGQLYLGATTRSQDSGRWAVERVQLPLPASVLAVRHTESGIQLMCLDPQQTDLKIVEVTGLNITEEFTYEINLLYYPRSGPL